MSGNAAREIPFGHEWLLGQELVAMSDDAIKRLDQGRSEAPTPAA